MNPWINLPLHAPFIAPRDRLALEDPKYDASGFRFDAFPDPFVGDINRAGVVFLALNPGFEAADIEVNLRNEYFLRESRLNLTHQSTVSFFYLTDELKDTFGHKWWRKLLNPIMTDEDIPLEVIRENMMIVEYMPYHSRMYKHNKIILPSQRYSFDLVRKAIDMGKIIIIMRSKKFWLDAVPELNDYDYLELSNVQTPWISRKNLMPLNPPYAYDRVAAALSKVPV